MSSYNKLETINPSSYEFKSTGRKFGEAGFECLATFLFMFTIFFSRGEVKIFAFGFWVIISVFGGISGAHVNPAITLGFYITEQDWVYGLLKMGLHICAQVLGCVLGVLLGYPFLGNEPMFFIGTGTETEGRAFFGEFFLTGTFFFIIAIVCHPKHPPTNIAPINTALIVAWFYMAAEVGGKLSGSAFNPAVLLAINLTASFTSKGSAARKNIGVEILGEFLGVILFALIYRFVYCPFYELIQEEKKSPAKEFAPAEIKIAEN
jgi:glycerol uptake facilitator protein